MTQRKPRLGIVLAHAPWHPHRSGSRIPYHLPKQENMVSRDVSRSLTTALQLDPIELMPMEIASKYNCAASCLNSKGRHRCDRYTDGLDALIMQSKHVDLAISFHLDWSQYRPDRSGPLVLSTGARGIAFGRRFLDVFCGLTGQRRRGTKALDGVKYNGVFDWSQGSVRKAWGRRGRWAKKGFLEYGCRHAAIIEIGCLSNAKDAGLLGCGSNHLRSAAMAAADAVRDVLCPREEGTNEE